MCIFLVIKMETQALQISCSNKFPNVLHWTEIRWRWKPLSWSSSFSTLDFQHVCTSEAAAMWLVDHTSALKTRAPATDVTRWVTTKVAFDSHLQGKRSTSNPLMWAKEGVATATGSTSTPEVTHSGFRVRAWSARIHPEVARGWTTVAWLHWHSLSMSRLTAQLEWVWKFWGTHFQSSYVWKKLIIILFLHVPCLYCIFSLFFLKLLIIDFLFTFFTHLSHFPICCTWLWKLTMGLKINNLIWSFIKAKNLDFNVAANLGSIVKKHWRKHWAQP